jgi:hypothetical protein
MDYPLLTHIGTIVDAIFLDMPRKRNTRDENAKFKAGKVRRNVTGSGKRMLMMLRSGKVTKFTVVTKIV